MKKLILSIIFGLSFFFVNAQGNLQFNQVLTYTGSLVANNFSPNYTVPSGKVWKIEFCKASTDDNFKLRINNVADIDISRSTTVQSASFWLKETDMIKVFTGSFSGTFFISIIEYNIVQ